MRCFFDVWIYQLAGAQQTSTSSKLRDNQTKLVKKNVSSWDHFAYWGNNKTKWDDWVLLWVSLQNLNLYVNPELAHNVNIRFSNITCFLQNLTCFLLLWEAGTKFIQLRIKFWVKRSMLLAPEYTSLLLHNKPVQRNDRPFF